MNELATISAEEERELAIQLGLVENTTALMPKLKLNYQEEDDMERPLKKGTFVLTGQDEDVYADEITFRPISQYYQWLDYDTEQEKVVNKTLMIPNFKVEPRDKKGTVRCGKPSSRYLEENPDEKALYKSITCFRMVYGIVEYTGKTADGKEVTVGPTGCVLMLKGSNFMPFGREVVDKMPSNKHIYNYNCKVTSVKKKEGSVIFYVMKFEPDLLNPLGMDSDLVEAMKVVLDFVKKNNEDVNASYEQALRDKNSDGSINEALSGDLVDG
jgi:hypothetical protein